MNWEQKYDALASMIEGYRHERNEALERLRLLEAEVERVNAREDATRRELSETRIDMRDMERERDEARREADRFRHGCTVEGDFVCPNEHAVSELTAERNFLRALKKNHEEDFTRVCKERDEARDELVQMQNARAHVHGCLDQALEERDEARAEVREYREQLRKLPDANRIASQDAYHRGAEAMREACADEVMSYTAWSDPPSIEFLERQVLALPIPEEP